MTFGILVQKILMSLLHTMLHTREEWKEEISQIHTWCEFRELRTWGKKQVANCFHQFLLGPAMHMILESVSGTPQLSHNMGQSADDLVILVVFYAWMILQLLPVMVETLVYEKQQKLRIMMGMHGLGNGAYWFIMYMYFLIVSSLYMCCYLLSGTLTRRRIFTMNSFSLQCTFYFIYINLQITTSFLLALLFKRVRTASVVRFLIVFGAGLAGATVSVIWLVMLR